MEEATTTLLIASITYKTAILSTFIGIVGTLSGYLLNYYLDKKKREEERHVEEKRETFQKLLSHLLWNDAHSTDKEDIQNLKDAVSNTELFGSEKLCNKMYDAFQLIIDGKWEKGRSNPMLNEIKTLMKKELKIK